MRRALRMLTLSTLSVGCTEARPDLSGDWEGEGAAPVSQEAGHYQFVFRSRQAVSSEDFAESYEVEFSARWGHDGVEGEGTAHVSDDLWVYLELGVPIDPGHAHYFCSGWDEFVGPGMTMLGTHDEAGDELVVDWTGRGGGACVVSDKELELRRLR